ncbi:MAG: hypothetical protein JRJ31_17625 [Deltaproteobacteria bacterium]|nr:hypothetical protein [Deltaproteobacteria bacterium]
MYQKVYYVDKRTGTFADVFLAYGVATLLDSVLTHFLGNDHWVRIRDYGPYYAIELSHCLREEWVDQAPFPTLAPYIYTDRSNQEDLASLPASMIVDYEQEWNRFRRFIQLPQDDREKMPQEQLVRVKPHPQFPIFAWVGERRMQAVESYNKLILRWQGTTSHFNENLRHILMFCFTPGLDVGAVESAWRKRMRELGVEDRNGATLLQLFNPSQGKGLNEPKASRLKMGNIESFWLLEYLKAVGMYHCAVPRRVQGTGDRKTYALAPVNMRLGVNDQILDKFQEALWNDTAVKMDILAALHYTRCFLDYCQAAKEADLLNELFGQGPENFVAGMYVAYYKSLGQASAVMNLSFIELPRWMRVESVEDVNVYKEVIEEHENIIRSIDEVRGGYDLLVYYRDFLSGGKWTAFFDFTAAYGPFLMRELDRDHYWVRPFTTKNLEVLIMKSNEPLGPILETPGFRNIAEAIRRSTIIPQYRGRGESEYDIRYGLGQELKRKALYNDEFIATLSEFTQSYNAENARVYEKTGKQYRKNILTTDIEDIVRLIDRYGAVTIASLLIAFGYAREPKEEEETIDYQK